MKKLFIAALTLSLVSLSPIAQADNSRLEKEVYADPAYQANLSKARTDLESRGYQVTNITVTEHQGKKALKIEAFKNGQEWNVCLDYPSLRTLSEKRDKW